MSPLRKRGNVFFLDTRVEGKRHRISLNTSDYYLALDKARDIERALGKMAKSGPQVTFEDFRQKYLTWAWSSKPKSADREEQRLRIIAEWVAGQGLELLSSITPYHVEQLRAYLRDRGAGKSTINRYMQILRCFFYRAIEWGDFSGDNPIRRVKFYREDIEIRPLTDEQIEAVLAKAREQAAKPRSPLQRVFPDLIELSLSTGLRKAEALNLKWSDVRGDCAEISIVGKGDKRRTIPLNDVARAIIKKQPRGAEYIFNIPNRGQSGIFRRTTETIRKATNVPFHFHALRHTFATRLLAAGVDIVTISSLLGHGRSMTTLLYSHTDPDRQRRAVEALVRDGVPTKRAHGTGIRRQQKTKSLSK